MDSGQERLSILTTQCTVGATKAMLVPVVILMMTMMMLLLMMLIVMIAGALGKGLDCWWCSWCCPVVTSRIKELTFQWWDRGDKVEERMVIKFVKAQFI